MGETVQQNGDQVRSAEIGQSLERVLTGHSFRSSAQCQALLRYIVEHSLSHQYEMLRERVIGASVFGRASDYDSGNDPIVRARAAEVRKRLAQHYLQDGENERIRIVIPPGSYKAIFEERSPNEVTDSPRAAELNHSPVAGSANQVGESREPLDPIDDNATPEPQHSRIGNIDRPIPHRNDVGLRTAILSVVSVAVVIGLAGFLFGRYSSADLLAHQKVQDTRSLPSLTDDPVSSFWAPFLREDRSPIIAYADAMFLIDGSGDLFRFRHGASDNRGVLVEGHLARQFASNPSLVANAGPLFYDNGYTGTGDLRAMAMLITQLAHMGATPIIKSSYDISTDDLKQHNVILLGSSAENLAVAQLVPTGDFLFQDPASSHDPWSGQIANNQPHSGEQSTYNTVRDPVTHVLEQDFALVSFEPSVTPEHQIAILGGIDTTGTEGAALFVTSSSGVGELTNAFSDQRLASSSNKPQAFQALIRVDVKKGYQVLGAQLITVHPLETHKSAK